MGGDHDWPGAGHSMPHHLIFAPTASPMCCMHCCTHAHSTKRLHASHTPYNWRLYEGTSIIIRQLGSLHTPSTHTCAYTILLTPCICAAMSSCFPSLSIIAFLSTAQLSHLSSVHLLHHRLHRLGVWRLPGQPVYQAHRADSRSSSRPSCRDRRIQCLACNTQ